MSETTAALAEQAAALGISVEETGCGWVVRGPGREVRVTPTIAYRVDDILFLDGADAVMAAVGLWTDWPDAPAR